MASDDRPGLRAVLGPEPERAAGAAVGEVRLTPAEGRKFGFTLGAAAAVVAGLLAWRGHAVAAFAVAGVGMLLAAAALAIPTRLGPVRRGWLALARTLARVSTPLILALIYFVVFTPVGVLRRRLGGDPLRHPEKDGTHWISRGQPRQGDLRRQF